MKKIEFKCVRCGTCCSNMRGPMFGIISGLGILPDETNLFSPHLVKPYIRYMVTAPDRPGWVFMYQVDAGSCPHYDPKEKRCVIYDKRPRICRAFPFELTYHGTTAHESCPQIHGMSEKINKRKAKCMIPKKYQLAMIGIHEWYNRALIHPFIERFDLATNTWKRMTEGLTEDEEKWLRGRSGK